MEVRQFWSVCDDGLDNRHGGNSDEDVDKSVIDLVPDALSDCHPDLLFVSYPEALFRPSWKFAWEV